MAPGLRLLLVWACACVFLQLDGADGDSQCAFPFKYNGVTYFQCTLQNSFFRWCSLTTKYNGQWKYCTKEDHAKCVFPFHYKGKEYHECTSVGLSPGKLWCSLSPDYDKDGAWRFCPASVDRAYVHRDQALKPE
ncbi:PREDICTED: seminal plasma protein A3-like [Condylura cristata]|uniref:seminal plasma protein A3-like n=1 Tax=Condylura cristata TaxID=143302 RepID=UPI000643991E|nr:PREDICTED: seminal plasma protein A3-like [Condylura cristata]